MPSWFPLGGSGPARASRFLAFNFVLSASGCKANRLRAFPCNSNPEGSTHFWGIRLCIHNHIYIYTHICIFV